MTEHAESALRVQRDSAHRKITRLETHNRLLRKHQEEIRTWLAKAIQDFEDARTDPARVLQVADEIHQIATTRLGDVQRILET